MTSERPYLSGRKRNRTQFLFDSDRLDAIASHDDDPGESQEFRFSQDQTNAESPAAVRVEAVAEDSDDDDFETVPRVRARVRPRGAAGESEEERQEEIGHETDATDQEDVDFVAGDDEETLEDEEDEVTTKGRRLARQHVPAEAVSHTVRINDVDEFLHDKWMYSAKWCRRGRHRHWGCRRRNWRSCRRKICCPCSSQMQSRVCL